MVESEIQKAEETTVDLKIKKKCSKVNCTMSKQHSFLLVLQPPGCLSRRWLGSASVVPWSGISLWGEKSRCPPRRKTKRSVGVSGGRRSVSRLWKGEKCAFTDIHLKRFLKEHEESEKKTSGW